MNVRKKRHIASWILLAVFVPMLVMSSLHLHHSQTDITDSCSECVHHHCHGHLLQTDTDTHNCVMCHFLTIPFVAATAVAVIYCKVIRVNHARVMYDLPEGTTVKEEQ